MEVLIDATLFGDGSIQSRWLRMGASHGDEVCDVLGRIGPTLGTSLVRTFSTCGLLGNGRMHCLFLPVRQLGKQQLGACFSLGRLASLPLHALAYPHALALVEPVSPNQGANVLPSKDPRHLSKCPEYCFATVRELALPNKKQDDRSCPPEHEGTGQHCKAMISHGTPHRTKRVRSQFALHFTRGETRAAGNALKN